ncbi:MAG: SOS response-associated peptidase family protein [Oligoflexus sp.]
MCYSVMIEQDLKALELHFQAKPDEQAFNRYHQLSQQNPKTFRPLADHPRIYPYYFAPVVVMKDQNPTIIPMRYRLRPAGTEKEVPNQYNLYNARLDGLMNRQIWKKLFGKKHGLLAFQGFFEWVIDDKTKKKKVIYFHRNDKALITVPVLYDIWRAADESQGFASFAIITGEPPIEVERAGHDRCPIPLDRSDWDSWLCPQGSSQQKLLTRLKGSEAQVLLQAEDAVP